MTPLIFISARSTDYQYAEQIYRFLKSQGLHTFFSQESLPELASSDYRKQIDDALDSAQHMIVVTSSRANVTSSWVEAEWGLFINEKRSGRKAGNLITVVAGDLRPSELPASLRYYEVIPFQRDAFQKILRYVASGLNEPISMVPSGHLRTTKEESLPPNAGTSAVIAGSANPAANSQRVTQASGDSAVTAVTVRTTADETGRPSGPQRSFATRLRQWLAQYRIRALAGVLVTLVAAALMFKVLPFREPQQPPRGEQVVNTKYVTNRDAFLGALPWLIWIAYDPTDYDPFQNREASEASIRKDLQVLRRFGFDGLITMTSKGTCQHIPRIAHEEGFQMVITGVWDLRNKDEIANALLADRYSDAYCLGHRGMIKRYSIGELEPLMEAFRNQTGRPVSTTELIGDYETDPKFAGLGDFLFPDVHTMWHNGQSPQEAWSETLALAQRASKAASSLGKLVLMKMISFPSGGAERLSPKTQAEFYRLAAEESVDRNDIPANVSFSYMTAFDPVFKTEDQDWKKAEQYTGLFSRDRKPKPAVTEVTWKKPK